MPSDCVSGVTVSVTQRLVEEDLVRAEGPHHPPAIMGNTPTAKKGNEMESGEYPQPVVELEELAMSCCHWIFLLQLFLV